GKEPRIALRSMQATIPVASRQSPVASRQSPVASRQPRLPTPHSPLPTPHSQSPVPSPVSRLPSPVSRLPVPPSPQPPICYNACPFWLSRLRFDAPVRFHRNHWSSRQRQGGIQPASP